MAVNYLFFLILVKYSCIICILYSTAQLLGNVHKCLKLIWDVSRLHTRCIRASAKPRDKGAARLT